MLLLKYPVSETILTWAGCMPALELVEACQLRLDWATRVEGADVGRP